MRIVVIGLGKVGRAMTAQLTAENNDIVVIDQNPDLIEDIVNIYDVRGVPGNGGCYDVQKEAFEDGADLLIATTSIDTLCAALRMLHVPDILVTLLLLTYRYIGVMMEEVAVMTEAYSLRAPGQKGIHISAWGSFLGQLLLRSMDRAEALYHSMLLRGFRGEYYYAEVPKCGVSGIGFTVICCLAFVCARWVNLPALLGGLFVR